VNPLTAATHLKEGLGVVVWLLPIQVPADNSKMGALGKERGNDRSITPSPSFKGGELESVSL
jgi:hypothetical protein